MSRTCLHELLPCLRYDYRQTSGKGAKGIIIDQWCRASGHERKYAIKELRAQRGRESNRCGGPQRWQKSGQSMTFR